MHQECDCHYCSATDRLQVVQRNGKISPRMAILAMLRDRHGSCGHRPDARGPVTVCWNCLRLFARLRVLLDSY